MFYSEEYLVTIIKDLKLTQDLMHFAWMESGAQLTALVFIKLRAGVLGAEQRGGKTREDPSGKRGRVETTELWIPCHPRWIPNKFTGNLMGW